jgi:uncharacterized membrane protein
MFGNSNHFRYLNLQSTNSSYNLDEALFLEHQLDLFRKLSYVRILSIFVIICFHSDIKIQSLQNFTACNKIK